MKLGVAVVAAAAGGSLALAPAPSANADIPVLYNGLLSTTGCQVANAGVIKTCSKMERLSPNAPVILNLNPVGTRIVVLGARLNNNGSMPGVLLPRLDAALQLARGFPAAGIITTGGMTNRRAGRTEAQAMKDWLVRHGIAPHRIATEGRSRSTVENAKFVAPMLRAGGASGVVVVTTNDHLRRAMANFRSAVAGSIPVAGVIPGDGNASGSSSGSLGSMGSS